MPISCWSSALEKMPQHLFHNYALAEGTGNLEFPELGMQSVEKQHSRSRFVSCSGNDKIARPCRSPEFSATGPTVKKAR